MSDTTNAPLWRGIGTSTFSESSICGNLLSKISFVQSACVVGVAKRAWTISIHPTELHASFYPQMIIQRLPKIHIFNIFILSAEIDEMPFELHAFDVQCVSLIEKIVQGRCTGGETERQSTKSLCSVHKWINFSSEIVINFIHLCVPRPKYECFSWSMRMALCMNLEHQSTGTNKNIFRPL